jgi:hypothetical protein
LEFSMNLAFLANNHGGKKDKIADKASLKPDQAESMELNAVCVNETCACNWKPTKQAKTDKREQTLDNVWRGA